jgi:hypothetical protein
LKYTDPSGYGWGDNDGEDGNFDSSDSSTHTSNDNQAEENDFNGSEESGDGSGDSFEDRARYDSRITGQNNKELSRLNLQYKVDTVINFIRDLFSVGEIVFAALVGKRVGLAKTVNKAKFEPKGRGGVKQNIHTNATRAEVKESLKANGFKERSTKNPDVSLFENEKGQRYGLRSRNSSGLNGSTLDYYGTSKRPDTEIRLGD